MSAETEAVVRRWFEEVWGNRSAAAIDELLAPGSVVESDGRSLVGPEEFKQVQFLPFVAAFPDLVVTLAQIESHGDEVVVHWKAEGTHLGPGVPGVLPTGKCMHAWGISWILVRDGRFQAGRQVSSLPLAFARLGFVPPAP